MDRTPGTVTLLHCYIVTKDTANKCYKTHKYYLTTEKYCDTILVNNGERKEFCELMIENALKAAFTEGTTVLIPCGSKAQQESIRVMTYRLKKKIIPAHMQDEIGITKVEAEDKLFIKVYKRDEPELFTFDKDGNVVKLEAGECSLSSEMQRIVDLMRKDGVSEEDVQKFLEENKG